jgi:methylase of polypeptide subunit release factors
VTDPVRALGEQLRATGFDEAGVKRALGGVELWKARVMGDARPSLAPEPLATLVSLLHVRRPVARDVARVALGAVPLDALVDEGLLADDDGRVTASFQITPWLGLLVAHDTFDASDVPADHVVGGSRAAETLARGTIRVRSGRTLDLGCASGVQALLAASHSGHVIATDVNPRAVGLTRLNARLNGFDQVEAREGSWFEPVEGERFDLVVANPPYVISPDSDFLFRDGGAEADSVSRMVVRGVGEHLAPGGIGHVLCNWALRPGEVRHPVAEWVEGLGCDAYVLDFGPESVVEYAARWNEHLAIADPPAYDAAVGRWLAEYRRLGIETISFGLVILRRRFAGEPWFRTVAAGAGPVGFGGAQLLRAIEAFDYLEDSGPEPPLLDERLALVEGHVLTHRMRFSGGTYGKPTVTLTVEGGLGLAIEVDPTVVLVLEALDGERVLSQVLTDVVAEQELDARELSQATLATARELLELGLLERR